MTDIGIPEDTSGSMTDEMLAVVGKLPVLFQDHIDIAASVGVRPIVIGAGTSFDHRLFRDSFIDDRVVVLRNHRVEDFAFPGGHVDRSYDSVVRELYDETQVGLGRWKREEPKKAEGSSLLTKLLRRL